MSQLSEIYEGWKNFVFPNSDIEKEAKRRIEICVANKCGKFSSRNICRACGCYMPAKVRSPKSRCILKKW